MMNLGVTLQLLAFLGNVLIMTSNATLADLSYRFVAEIKICEDATHGPLYFSDGSNQYGPVSGVYDYEPTSHDDDSGMYLQYTNDYGFEIAFDDGGENMYYIGDINNPTDRAQSKWISGVPASLYFFEYLVRDRNGCVCGSTAPSFDVATYFRFDLGSYSGFTDSSGSNTISTISACITLDYYNQPNNDNIYDPYEYKHDVYDEFYTTFTPNPTLAPSLANWECDKKSLTLCNDLSKFLGVEYKGVEAIIAKTDTSPNDPTCDVVRPRSGNRAGFRCKTCLPGYRRYANGDVEFGGNVHHKCMKEENYFPNCITPINRGCKACDTDYVLRSATWPTWGNFCPYGFCVYESGAQIVTTTAPGYIPLKCRKQADRMADSEYKKGIYWISDPWNQTECINEAINGDIAYCIEDGLCDHGFSETVYGTETITSDNNAGCHIDGSCSQCLNQPYSNFKLSQFHRCQNVASTFGAGCLLANEGVGCGQCVAQDTEIVKSVENEVWYCPGNHNVSVDASDFITNTQDKDYTEWKCPLPIEESTANINAGYFLEKANGDFYGVDCDFDSKCVDCDPKHLCGQCENDNSGSTLIDAGSNVFPAADDYFRPSEFHQCVNCAETFGHACLFCDDYRGCSQCKDGYILQFDACCELWHCI